MTPEPVLLELVQPQPVRLEPVLVQELVQEREQVVRLESAPPRKRCTQQGRQRPRRRLRVASGNPLWFWWRTKRQQCRENIRGAGSGRFINCPAALILPSVESGSMAGAWLYVIGSLANGGDK